MDEDAKYHTGEAKALGQYVGFQVEGKKVVLEQQYVSMLEQRVSQLQKLVEPLTTRETNVSNSTFSPALFTALANGYGRSRKTR